MNKNQRGIVDIWFVVVLVVLIAAAVFTLWQINKADETVSDTESNTNSQSALVNQQNKEEASENNESSARSDNWTRVTSGQGGFAISLPDGWRALSIQDSDWISIRSAQNTVFEEGVAAVIEELASFGTDGPARINIIQFQEGDQYVVLDGNEEVIGDFAAGELVGTKYFKKYPIEPIEGIGPFPGQEKYTYKFESGTTTTFVTYNRQTTNEFSVQLAGIEEDEPDILSVVEEMIRTLVIN
ncbi:MAG: hypothetical protein R3313_00645 [Candidatus Saccharimonadales bacterium]|nr:hypothetical protein [Candidatus Saccharimonadales bacterium]